MRALLAGGFLEAYGDEYEFVVVVDIDRAKHGTGSFGVPVVAPEWLRETERDDCGITSMYVAEIREQLVSGLHVDASKVVQLFKRSASPH